MPDKGSNPRCTVPGDSSDPHLRPFSPLQWKFAISSMTVHFVAACKRPFSRAASLKLFEDFVRLAPQLRFSMESDLGGHRDPGVVSIETDGTVRGVDLMYRYSEAQEFSGGLGGHLEIVADIYNNPELPAFRARCETRGEPDATGTSSLISMTLAHTLFDGADLNRALSGLPVSNEGIEQSRAGEGMSALRRAALWLAAVPMAPAFLFLASRERRRIEDFRFVALSVDRQVLREACRRHRVSRSALLIAIVLQGLMLPLDGKGSVQVMNMRIPQRRFQGHEDGFLQARTEILRLQGQPELASLAVAVAEKLTRKGFGKSAMPFLTSRMLSVIRWLHARVPILIPKQFKGYTPADILFSIVPPLDPVGPFTEFRDAAMFAGICTGMTPSCVVLTGPEVTTLTFWIEKDRATGRLDRLLDLFAQEGIRATYWT